MADALLKVSDGDLAVLRSVIADWKARKGVPINTRGQGNPIDEQDGIQAPEVYIARAPAGGVPALDANATGTAADDVPGSAVCDLYRMTVQGDLLVQMGTAKTVYNLTGTAIAEDTWFLAVRDKWGRWVAVPIGSPAAGSGFFARLTTVSGDLWKWVRVAWSGTAWVDNGSESITYNAVSADVDPLTADDKPAEVGCYPGEGRRVWMWPSVTAGYYEFLFVPDCVGIGGDNNFMQDVDAANAFINGSTGDNPRVITETFTKIPANYDGVIDARVYGTANAYDIAGSGNIRTAYLGVQLVEVDAYGAVVGGGWQTGNQGLCIDMVVDEPPFNGMSVPGGGVAGDYHGFGSTTIRRWVDARSTDWYVALYAAVVNSGTDTYTDAGVGAIKNIGKYGGTNVVFEPKCCVFPSATPLPPPVTTTYDTPGADSHTIPAGHTTAVVECWGGGGGGAGVGVTVPQNSGGGGGGGEYAKKTFTGLTPLSTINFVVGAAGTAGAGGGFPTAGGDGGDTTWDGGTALTAKGGVGGGKGGATEAGGDGGTGGTGDVTHDGGAGGTGNTDGSQAGGAGGGGGGGTTASGSAGGDTASDTGASGGAGGTSGGGAGGDGCSKPDPDGTAGTQPGGGGGGGAGASHTSGKAGGAGRIRVTTSV